MSLFYSAYSDFTDSVQDQAASYIKNTPRISEKIVRCLWMDRHFISPLHTTSGEHFTILEPGRWNLEEGPDFLGALIAFKNKKPVQGNIEIHLYSKDWIRHGHHNNKNFKDTLIHAFLWDNSKEDMEMQQGIKQCHLSPFLPEEIETLAAAIDVTNYPFFTENILGQCNPQARKAGLQRVREVLAQAGDERIRKKSLRIQYNTPSPEAFDQFFYQQLMEAAGYRRNRSQFKKLATEIPLALIKKELFETAIENRVAVVKAILFGAPGLLPTKIPQDLKGTGSDYFSNQQKLWKKLSSHIPGINISWNTYGIRPANTPHRRIAWMGEMLGTLPLDKPLFKILISSFLDYDQTKRWGAFFKKVKEVCEKSDPFWSHHYSMNGKELTTPAKLLGDGRLKTIIVNVLIPAFLHYSKVNKNHALEEKIHHIFTSIPSTEPNTLTRLMEHRLIGCPIRKKNARIEQGLIQVFEDFCISNPEGCIGCRFPELL